MNSRAEIGIMARQKDPFENKTPAITGFLLGKEPNCGYIMFYVQFLLLAWSNPIIEPAFVDRA
jgi:hypothetical protein